MKTVCRLFIGLVGAMLLWLLYAPLWYMNRGIKGNFNKAVVKKKFAKARFLHACLKAFSWVLAGLKRGMDKSLPTSMLAH